MEQDKKKLEGLLSAMRSASDINISEEILEEDEEEGPPEDNPEESLPDWEEDELEDFETPEIRELIEIGKGLCKGTVSEEELEELLDYLNEELTKYLTEFYKIKKSYTSDSFMIKELIIRIERAFKMYREGLEEIDSFFEDEDIDHIMDGLITVQSSINRLYKAFHIIEEREEFSQEDDGEEDILWKAPSLSRVPVDSESIYDMVIDDEEDEYYTNPNFEKLKEAVEKFGEDRITGEEFLSVLDWMEKNITEGREDIEEIDISDIKAGEDELIPYMVKNSLEAFDLYEKGLEEIRRFLMDRNPLHLDNGLGMAFEAVQELGRIEESFEDPEEIIFFQ